MRNVKWTTGLYILTSTVSIVITVCGIYWALKGDIQLSRTESKEQITAVATAIKKSADSTQHFNEFQFQAIWNEIKEIRGGKPYRSSSTSGASPLFTEKYVNGHLTFIPVR